MGLVKYRPSFTYRLCEFVKEVSRKRAYRIIAIAICSAALLFLSLFIGMFAYNRLFSAVDSAKELISEKIEEDVLNF
jgi:hypothetical protein